MSTALFRRGDAVLEALDRSHAIIEFSPTGKIIRANENFLRTMGYAAKEIIGKHHRIFVDQSTNDEAQYQQFWRELAQGAFKQAEFKRIDKSGREVWLQATYNPILGLGGRTARVIKFATDITAIKRRNADYAGQVAAIGRSQAVVEFELDGTIINANDKFLQALGYELAEIQGRHHSLFLDRSQTDADGYRDFWASLARGEYRAGKFKRSGKGGREVWIEASYNPIMDADGRPFKVVKYATDITRHTVESADHRGQIEAIRKSQAVIEFAMDGTVVSANEKFLNLFGYTLAELQGKHHSLFLQAGEAERPEYRAFWHALNKGEYQAAQYKRVGKGGRDVWIEANYNPIADADGRLVKVVKFATDITAQMRQAESLKILSLVADGTDNSVIITNAAGLVEYVNPGFTG